MESPEVLEESRYISLPDFLPSESLLVFNNSRVIEARIIFQKPSGGQIEVFCLEPHPSYNISTAMTQTGKVLWICLIGGASKWKHGQVLEKKIGETKLEARFIEKRKDDFLIEFSWTPAAMPFALLLHQLGSIPLPPLFKTNGRNLRCRKIPNGLRKRIRIRCGTHCRTSLQ